MPGWIEFSAKICAVNSQFKVASFYFFKFLCQIVLKSEGVELRLERLESNK